MCVCAAIRYTLYGSSKPGYDGKVMSHQLY